nr:hypothetical protein [Tanacetum cinerariifolium]
MSTQQDIYAAGSESRPPMLNKENYVPWSSHLLRKMIPEPGDANHEITVTETFHLQTDDELFDKELKQIEADDQAIQTIFLSLPEDIYAAEKKAKLFSEWEMFTSNEGGSIEFYYHRFLKLMNDLKRNKHFPEKIASNLKFLKNLQPKWSRHVTIVHQTKDLHTADYTQLYDFLNYNQKENYLQQPIPNPKDITDPTTAMNMALALMAKAFKLNYSTPTNNNQRISSNPRNMQIAQPGMNMGQDRQMQMVGGNGGNQFRQYAGQNAGNSARYNDVIGNQEEAGIQLQVEEYDLMAAAADLDEIEEVNAKSKFVGDFKSLAKEAGDSLAKHKALELEIEWLLKAVEAAKFVEDFKSLANEADASLAKHKALELEIERLLKAVVSQDIMIIVQNESVVDTSDL